MLISGSGRVAKIHYMDGTFRLIDGGDHVLCAVNNVTRRWSLTDCCHFACLNIHRLKI